MKFLIIFVFLSFILIINTSFKEDVDGVSSFNWRPKELRLTIVEISKEGKVWRTYIITKSKLRIYEKPFHSSNFREHVFTDHKFKSEAFFREVSELRLDTLRKLYINNCAKPDLTQHQTLLLKDGTKVITIELQHYYKKEIHALVQLINSYLGGSSQIAYLPPTTNQDCP